mgnify:CR=1 FL=1
MVVDFNFKKKYGQNFLKDKRIIDSIIYKADVDKDTLVIEVGPGAGALTVPLALKAGRVISFEIDESLKDILSSKLNEYNNVEVIYGDFLKGDVNNVLKRYDFSKKIMVSNLPYYITTPIIMKFIDDNIDVSKLVIMVQKEVALRFSASVNSREYNSLTVFLNYYYDIKKLVNVPRTVFVPVPNVDSVVIELKKKENKLYVKNEEVFFKLVRDSFKFKRKTLKNNLRDYDLDKIEKILMESGLSLQVRAEALSLEMFVKIANGL